ncbi:MAG TPA: hypothetical protein VHJ99_11265 [Candidatus Dormibacteraeota bacterium]|jgi:hypothetical protein|nr:hypothetical protein [Candidatus Dormibacteraeota bacterium]
MAWAPRWWVVFLGYLGLSILHAAFDSFGSIVLYIVISVVGLVPPVPPWWRSDRSTFGGRSSVTIAS